MEYDSNIFIRKFNVEAQGFYDITPYIDGSIGFSFKKRLNENDINKVSLFCIYIFKNVFEDDSITKKPLNIYAYYGEEKEGGVSLQPTLSNLSEPLNATFLDEYFYNPKEDKFYKESEEISEKVLIREIYEKHIKNTKPIIGFFLRVKIRFWRDFLRLFFVFLSKIFYYLLFIISGDKYTYEYLFEEETLNGEIIKSKLSRFRNINDKDIKETKKEGKKIDFFGLRVSQWSIVFYSFLHLSLYSVVVYKKYYSIFYLILWKILQNNFLTVVYAIFTFWVIEIPIPYILRRLIKYNSGLSAKCHYKEIKL